MITEKAYAICILEILKEYSDSEHIMQMKEIQEKMQLMYEVKPDRRTVYSAIRTLLDLGYDISIYDENKKGYFLRSRIFEPSEAMLLAEAVYSFSFISTRQTEDLVSKIQKQMSCYRRKQHKNLRIVKQEYKTVNQQVFWNIDQLDEAISDRRRVSFTYLKYGFDRKMHLRRQEKYVVSPHAMVYLNEHFYLMCSYKNYPPALYRVDRMKDTVVLKEKAEYLKIEREDVEKAVYAFFGRPEAITLRCDDCVLDDLIDKFGTDIHIIKDGESDFTTIIHAAPAGIKFWALQYLSYVEVISPEWLRLEIMDAIKENRYG